MFGLGKEKKGPADDWEFDLENDLKNDPKQKNVLEQQISASVSELKKNLREGNRDKKVFDDAQTLLHGYLAAQKVLQRVTRTL